MASPAQPRERDERLDFFRGLTMFVIFIAHADLNPWNGWIPARFGFSSGTELFVFCSGFASALAFGTIFVRRGLALGSARIVHRLWQVYWAQIGVVLAVFAVMVAGRALLPDAPLQLDLLPQITADPVGALTGLATLRWLPGYLDILPMYLVILALVPPMMAAAGIHTLLPLVLSAGLYGVVWTTGLNLPGNPWTGEGWFFNPFAWQLIFFTGFAIAMGWLRPPPLRDRRWMIAAVGFLLISLPLAFWGIRLQASWLQAIHEFILPANEKTDLHWLRYVHFLALAYLVLSLLEPWRHRLTAGAAMIVVAVGRQSLATFLVSLVAARAASLLFQWAGTGAMVSLAVNIAGIGIVIATAYIVAWFKSEPWRKAPGPDGRAAVLREMRRAA